ncbi:hypothetical protein [Sporosarcina sp. PTS2304]|nr:hypothetical protein [Sporosarcina sp. PTS2304]
MVSLIACAFALIEYGFPLIASTFALIVSVKRTTPSNEMWFSLY